MGNNYIVQRIVFYVIVGVLSPMNVILAQAQQPEMMQTFQLGTDFRQLSNGHSNIKTVLPTELNPTIEVSFSVEYFSHYQSKDAFRMEFYLDHWRKSLPKNINFNRFPLIAQPGDLPYAKLYYVIIASNLPRDTAALRGIYQAIRMNQLNTDNIMTTSETLAKIFILNKIPETSRQQFLTEGGKLPTEIQAIIAQLRGQYLTLLDPNKHQLELKRAKLNTENYQLKNADTFVIGGRYATDLTMAKADPKRLLNIVDYLIVLTENEAKAAAALVQKRVKLNQQKLNSGTGEPRDLLPGFD